MAARVRALGIRPRPFYNCCHTGISTLPLPGKSLFICRQTGTSLEMIDKRYGDARVHPAHLDEIIGEFEPPTRNLPDASGDPLPLKTKEPVVFYGLPTRAGDRRIGAINASFRWGRAFR